MTAPSMERRICPVGPFPLARICRTAQQCGVGPDWTATVGDRWLVALELTRP
jgi:hypothetical protein